jgi:hypothetical protein
MCWEQEISIVWFTRGEMSGVIVYYWPNDFGEQCSKCYRVF